VLFLVSVGLTVTFPKRPRQQSREGKRLACDALCLSLSVKTLEEQRQTAEREVLPTKVTGETVVWLAGCVARTLLPAKSVRRIQLRRATVFVPHKKQEQRAGDKSVPLHTNKYTSAARCCVDVGFAVI
jgi:hypothetical protein